MNNWRSVGEAPASVCLRDRSWAILDSVVRKADEEHTGRSNRIALLGKLEDLVRPACLLEHLRKGYMPHRKKRKHPKDRTDILHLRTDEA